MIIPSYRRFASLLSTVEDLLRQRYQDFEIVLADQNPMWPVEFQGRRNRLASDSRVNWFFLPAPGVVAARNEAFVRSTGEVVLFVDDDVAITDVDFLAKHARNYDDPETQAVAGREFTCANRTREEAIARTLATLNAAGRTQPGVDDWSSRHPLEQVLGFPRHDSLSRAIVCTFTTCNGSIRREAFVSVGGFDENFTGNSYGDDYDLALRLHAKGLRIIYDPDPWLIHLHHPAGGLRVNDPANPFSEAERGMSACVFVLRHAHRGWIAHLLYHHLLRKTVLAKRNVIRPWRQLVAWPGLALAMVRATGRVRRGPTSRIRPSSHDGTISKVGHVPGR